MLKRDFDGVAVGTRYGKATEGGLATHDYNVTAGTTWSTGGLIATWTKESNDPIYADQRDFTRMMYGTTTLYQGADLRGGLFSIHQSVGAFIELHLDALMTERDMKKEYGDATTYNQELPATRHSLDSHTTTFMFP